MRLWTLWDHDNQCMIGVHSVPMLVDAYLKGFKGVDWKRAFECVKKSITSNEGRWKAEYDILDQYGYYAYDKLKRTEGVSRMLECNYNDACASRMAAKLGLADDAKFFGDRSHCWTNCFDAATGFIRAKDSEGKWREPFDPFDLHPVNGEYVLGEALLPEISIKTGEGKKFTITSEGSGAGSVTLNGNKVEGPSIMHKDVMDGGALCFAPDFNTSNPK